MSVESQTAKPALPKRPQPIPTSISREFWQAGKPFYDPARITVPTLLVVAEWDRDTPPAMANALFPLLTASPAKRLVQLGDGSHTMLMERNRGALFQAVQVFLEEAIA